MLEVPNPTRTLVRLDNVDVDIDAHRILTGITLKILPGQHWGVIGGNGSGKSTLLSLIAGRRWPAPGRGSRIYDFGDGPETDAVTARQRVTLLGHELQDLYIARRWNFAARDIVRSGLDRSDIPKKRTTPQAEERADALLRAVGLEGFGDRRFFDLSRGTQRRVLIARSLAFEPALLLLDEPASGLDARSRDELERTLALVAAKTQIVMATHRQSELAGIVTETAVLRNGRLDTDASSEAGAGAGGIRPGTPITADSRRRSRIMISIDRASVWLGGQRVLRDIDWTLREGQHWLVTGENGSGKSTLLRLLHAELRPGRGSIAWPGLGDPKNVWALRRDVALVSPELQARYRYPTRVYDAVASGFHASIGLTRPLSAQQRQRVDALIGAFRLQGLEDRLLSSLSYGQRHRALIARTLVTRPKILLLDEPWEGLDSDTAELVAGEVGRYMAAGTQVVCVSHMGPGSLNLTHELRLTDGRLVNAGGSAALPENSTNGPGQAAGSRRR